MTIPEPERSDATTRIVAVTPGYGSDLLGVPLTPVLLTWVAESDDRSAHQVAYQLRTRGTSASDWVVAQPVESPESIEVEGPGGALSSREVREFAVRLATPSGWTDWSEGVVVEGGLAPSDLTALVVDVPSEIDGPVPTLRTEFAIDGAPVRARLHATALGVYDVFLNGTRIDDSVLNPGWTSYGSRILIDTVDVTALLRDGENAIAVRVADGWFRGRMGFQGRTAIYGDRIGALVQLEIDTEAGSSTVATDTTWRGGFGELRSASIYDGTVVDLRRHVGDPSVVGFDDRDWQQVESVPVDRSVFEPRGVAPVRPIDELPMTVIATGERTVLDAAQNIAGWVRLTVRGKAGDTVTIRHAEVLEPDGALHVAALRTAKATDVYTLAADGESVLEPAFTFHGFRYADVVTDAEFIGATAIAVSSAQVARSSFTSAHATLDRFHENVRWSQRDNFVSIPTDCPQRDERLGWTGDAQAFAPTASTLFESRDFWVSWLRDLELDQTDEGGVASVVPDIIVGSDMIMGGAPIDPMGRAGWADAAAIVPFAVYESYGGRDVLRRQLDSMRRWVGHLRRRAGDEVVLPTEPFQYGDWLDPDAPGNQPWAAKVSADYVANAFYVRSVRLLAATERLVGDESAAAELDALGDRVAAEAWLRWGTEAATTQTGAALALEFELAPVGERPIIASALAENVRAENGRIATGFLGTPLVLFALSKNGYLAEAYTMLLRRDAPSWLYQVDQGATTVWERWDAIKPDGSIHAGEMDAAEDDSMISFNHYAYGAMIDWVYRTVGGLATDPEAPGYRVVHVAPRPVVGIEHASAEITTPFGALSLDWRIDETGDFTGELVVPFGSEAHLDLPTGDSSVVTVGGEEAQTVLGHGRHELRVTSPLVVQV